ncbi:MAG: hypothetical protein RR328_02425 [Bacteroidales bacterium]
METQNILTFDIIDLSPLIKIETDNKNGGCGVFAGKCKKDQSGGCGVCFGYCN